WTRVGVRGHCRWGRGAGGDGEVIAEMPAVVGIEPEPVSLDICGLDDGRLFLDPPWPTADAVADPDRLAREVAAAGPVDLVVGPSGYGLPVSPAASISDDEVRIAFLSRPGDPGGIGGVRGAAP